jgi:hypothetical protein
VQKRPGNTLMHQVYRGVCQKLLMILQHRYIFQSTSNGIGTQTLSVRAEYAYNRAHGRRVGGQSGRRAHARKTNHAATPTHAQSCSGTICLVHASKTGWRPSEHSIGKYGQCVYVGDLNSSPDCYSSPLHTPQLAIKCTAEVSENHSYVIHK